ncbi:Alpha-9 giardin [Giardia muris]|uniref:Alpha-9 giardin n=1 Tax=Giardia muris TaxID=5742 RepID=A0A142C652_GIAMU|nr:alpha-9 giardin [Giardia muris]TNJ29108.1 Alpha-9 giardin [Giardia muris]|eukprot:TNJ29108.1 Alpha-9 giardin [Giardia muris]
MTTTVTDLAIDLKAVIDKKNEDDIVGITGLYEAKYRDKVIITYMTNYNISPSDSIKRAIKAGPSATLVMNAWTCSNELRARYLRNGLGTKNNKALLLDVALFCLEDDWVATVEAYTQVYSKNAKDDLYKDLNKKENWCALVRDWVLHDRTARSTIEADAEALYKALNGKKVQEVGQFLCKTTPDEWKRICRTFREVYHKEVDTFFTTEVFGKVDLEPFLIAHYTLLQPGYAAAYILNTCMSGKKGDSERAVRATSLMFDRALKCKFAYEKKYGNIANDFRKLFDARLAKALCTLWRVE